METECRITPRLIATLFILVIFLATFPAEAFHFPTRHQVIPVTSSLFSKVEEQHDQDPQREKDEQNQQTKLRKYQGGMIRPAVTAAKSEDPSLNFMSVNRQNTSLNNKDGINRSDSNSSRRSTESSMFRPSGMFRPSVARTNDDRSATNPPVSMPLDESKTAAYIAGEFNGDEADTKRIAKEDNKQLETEEEAMPKKASKKGNQIETSVEFNGFDMELNKKIEGEAEAKNKSEEIEENKKIEQNFEILEKIAEAEAKQTVEEERKRTKTETISKTESEAEKNAEERERIFGESKTEADTYIDVSAIEKEEAEKLKEIQVMVSQREEEQVELDKIEEELLRKTNEIKKSSKELLRLEDEFARAERAIRKNSDRSEEIRPRETNKTIPYYSPKEYSALSKEEKQMLKEDRAALGKIQQDKADTVRGDNSNANSNNKSAIHPILGPVIADLGYKRVHVVSSGRLGTIPIWEKQRTYRFDRAKRMAIDKTEQMHLGFLGIICLHEDAKGKLSIIDGQHRVGMMQALREDRKKLKKRQIETEAQGDNERMWKEQEEYFQNVLVEVYSELSTGDAPYTTNKGQSYAEQVFLEINKAEPILFDPEV